MFKPNWSMKYTFDEHWLDDILNKYDDELIKSVGDDADPIKYINIEPLNLENNMHIFDNLTIPDRYKLSEILLYILDCISYFSRYIPIKDSELYSFYKNNNIPYDFEKFYIFSNRIYYSNITKTNPYKLLSKTVDFYIANKNIEVNSTHNINYKNGVLKVKVLSNTNNNYNNNILYDTKIFTEVIDIIEPVDIKYVEKGTKLNLKPYYFNN